MLVDFAVFRKPASQFCMYLEPYNQKPPSQLRSMRMMKSERKQDSEGGEGSGGNDG